MSMAYEMRIMPESPLNPKEPIFMIADCGHEIMEGETVYWDVQGDGVICRDCAEEIARQLSLDEIMSLLGIAHGEYIPGKDIEWEV